jgi:hypothetical protein
MNEAELLDALRAELATSPEQARQLRTLAWWAANDARRPPAFDPDWESDTPLSPAAIENLEQLITLVDPDSPTGRLMHAEAARELGRFDAALSALADSFPVQLQQRAAELRRLAEAHDSKVRVFTD